MMSRDDPFGLSEDRERTRIRLSGAPTPRAMPLPASGVTAKRSSRAHPNALVNAF